MRLLRALVLALLGLATTQAQAWGNHSLVCYRAFERMPEVANATSLSVEPLEAFLQAEENTIEALLASQEAWAVANLEGYPRRPAALAFRSDGSRGDDAQRNAFLMALRVAPNSRFALYFQVDPRNPSNGSFLPNGVVSTQPDTASLDRKFVSLRSGDSIAALPVLASACDEPEYGLDVYLWDDSLSEWGRQFGFGPQPLGNPALAGNSQWAFHVGFLHENQLLYLAAPFLKRSYLLLRWQQYATLSSLAFRTGHAYWGWRFAGMSLHYVQDLAEPYHSSLAPGVADFKLLGVMALAKAGLPGRLNELLSLQSNRERVLEKYVNEMLLRDASRAQEGPLEKALHALDKDKSYPEWNERYLRDVVSAQAARVAPAVAQSLVAVMPPAYVSDPDVDFGAREPRSSLLGELGRRDDPERVRLDNLVDELMLNFGVHSRNALRGILRVGDPP